MRKSFSAELMAKVALDANKEEKTIAELSSQYKTHRTQITNWRKRALGGKDNSGVVLAVQDTQDTNNKLAETRVRRIGGNISGEGN
ncbi:MAG: hypothetical protein KGI30_10965 [Planctomycetota bacterium]|nr:hypothetical protein [Planctomycetota bacterium]